MTSQANADAAEGNRSLRAVLERHQALGMLGRAPIDDHIAQGAAVARCLAAAAPKAAVVAELGSGGGVPGLVVAAAWPETRFVLIERRARRAAALDLAVHELGWVGRVEVIEDDAGVVARSGLRGRSDAVLARAFGPAPVVVEYGAPLLRVGGQLLVTGSPSPTTWPEEALAECGLGPIRWSSWEGWMIGVSELQRLSGEDLPRSGSTPRRQPLFEPTAPE